MERDGVLSVTLDSHKAQINRPIFAIAMGDKKRQIGRASSLASSATSVPPPRSVTNVSLSEEVLVAGITTPPLIVFRFPFHALM